jgi:hypothetical protein
MKDVWDLNAEENIWIWEAEIYVQEIEVGRSARVSIVHPFNILIQEGRAVSRLQETDKWEGS